MKCVYVVGTDTEIGKTYVTASIARQLVRRDVAVGVYKPVASGAPLGTGASDPEILRIAARLEHPLSRVCPQVFHAPLAPPIAARLEGKLVNEPLILEGATWWRERCELLLVEGAGGVLSPISQNWTCLDLALQLRSLFKDDFAVLLVTQHRLGMVNQALMAVEAIQRRQLPLVGLFINQRVDLCAGEHMPSLPSNMELLDAFAPQLRCYVDVEPLLDSLTEAVGRM